MTLERYHVISSEQQLLASRVSSGREAGRLVMISFDKKRDFSGLMGWLKHVLISKKRVS